MLHSDKIDKIGPALLAVQKVVMSVELNAENPHFKNRYADLAATNAATREHLTEAGIVVTQWPGVYDADAKTMEMTTMLVHAESGQWMRGSMTIPTSKTDPQGYGSSLTYARRYALQAAMNLSPEDDDGEAGSSTKSESKQQPAPRLTEDEARKAYEAAIKAMDDAKDIPGLREVWDNQIKWASIPKGWHPRLTQKQVDRLNDLKTKPKATTAPSFPEDEIPF